MNPLADIVLIYTAPDGEVFEQPLSDITTSGTLIDPETGDDLELTGWRFAHGENFVVVEGGLVTNDPGLPVFDLDALDSDTMDTDHAWDVLDLCERIADHPDARGYLADELVSAAKIVRTHGTDEAVARLNDALAGSTDEAGE